MFVRFCVRSVIFRTEFSVASGDLHQSYNVKIRYCSRHKPVCCSFIYFFVINGK